MNQNSPVFDVIQIFDYAYKNSDNYQNSDFNSARYAVKIIGEDFPLTGQTRALAAQCLMDNVESIDSSIAFENWQGTNGKYWLQFNIKQ